VRCTDVFMRMSVAFKLSRSILKTYRLQSDFCGQLALDSAERSLRLSLRGAKTGRPEPTPAKSLDLEVEESEGFTRKTEGVREADFRLATAAVSLSATSPYDAGLGTPESSETTHRIPFRTVSGVAG
jgi:hypothetical protein